MSDDEFDDEGSFFQRNRVLLSVMAILFIGAGFVVKKLSSGHSSPPPRIENLASIRLVPPLPPPPPPPPPPKLPEPPPQEQKMVEQTPVNEPEAKPDPTPKDEPPAILGTGVVGPGADGGFNLGRSGNGGGSRIGGDSGHKGSRWGWYASQVQSRVEEAIRNNRRTRNAAMRIEVRVWPDPTGRVIRAALSGTTGDTALDAVLKNEVLTGLRLQAPPPEGMPTPIVMRLTARRPN